MSEEERGTQTEESAEEERELTQEELEKAVGGYRWNDPAHGGVETPPKATGDWTHDPHAQT